MGQVGLQASSLTVTMAFKFERSSLVMSICLRDLLMTSLHLLTIAVD